MDILPLLCIVSVALTGLTKGVGVLPDGPLIAAVGGTVMFNTTVTPTETPFLSVAWSFVFNNTQIPIITSTSSNKTKPEYEGRITLYRSTGSLKLRDLALNDSGEYRVSLVPDGGNQITGSTELKILVPVSNVKVNASSTNLVEFNSSVSLFCSSSGSSPSFFWLNGSSEVTASERVQFTDGGSILTIVNVSRYDQGPYSCKVSNAVSHNTSDPVNLSISFGPENITLKLSPSQEHYVEGSNISLSCSATSTPTAQFQWFLNGDKLPDTRPELTLINIQESQSGNYSCQAFNNKTLRYQTSQLSAIAVVVLVSNVKVKVSSTDLVEFNSSVSLFCSSSGSSPSFLWLNGSSEVTASERVQFTDGNSTLNIASVIRYDQGPFRCHVSNAFSNGTSDPVEISISFGPENIILELSPSQEHYVKGSNMSLSCSAVSRPSAQFKWFLNGDKLSDTVPELKLRNIQMSQSGNYSCQALNNKTLRYQTSQPSAITVLERVSDTSIASSTNQLIEGNPVNLTCDGAGSVFTREWMRNGSALTLTDNMTLYDKNRVLSFHSLKKTDSGEYLCKISNPFSNDEVKYRMVVNYGPENVEITGPSGINVKQTLTLTCSAASTPSASYSWILNGTKILNDSAVFTKDVTELSDSGNYTCQALNNITRRTSSAVHHVSVTEETFICLAGCIAGSVIACCVICGGAVTGGYCIYKKQTEKTANGNTSSRTGGEGQDNAAYSGNYSEKSDVDMQELNYADISFSQNMGDRTVRQGLQNNASEYSQIQENRGPAAASSPPSYDVHIQRMKRAVSQSGTNGAQIYAQVRKN